jgi:hypothetical protein
MRGTTRSRPSVQSGAGRSIPSYVNLASLTRAVNCVNARKARQELGTRRQALTSSVGRFEAGRNDGEDDVTARGVPGLSRETGELGESF